LRFSGSKEVFASKNALHSQAIELDPTNHVFYSNRSAAYLSSKLADKALEDAEACIKANPTWAKGFSRKGAALHELGRVVEAVAAYDEGLAIEPSNAGLQEGRQAAAAAQAQNPFADLAAWCTVHPKFREYMSDASFAAKITMLATNPSALSAVGADMRVMEVIAERLGLDLGGAPGGEDDGAMPPAGATSSAAAGAAEAAAAAAAEASPVEEPEPEYSEEEKAEMERERAEAAAAAKVRADADEAKARGNAFYKKREFGESASHAPHSTSLLSPACNDYCRLLATITVVRLLVSQTMPSLATTRRLPCCLTSSRTS
jgi:stress-induced-phosphoprotein 1